MFENEYRVRAEGGGFVVTHFHGDTDYPDKCHADFMAATFGIEKAEEIAINFAALDPAKALYVTRQDRVPARIIFPARIVVPEDMDVAAEFSTPPMPHVLG